jgi:hypothetical protein
LYVITTARKRDSMDWQTEAAQMVIGKERNATIAGKLTVDSWNNLHKYVGVENAFFIFDEQRLVGNGLWVKSFLKIVKNNRWIMLSATPGDTWLDYIPVFVANGFYKNRTEFKREHVVYKAFTQFPKVERYINVGKLVRHRNKILIKMPYEKETVRHEVNCWVDYDVADYTRVEKSRWHVFKDRPIKNRGEYFHVLRQVVNTDPSRLAKLRSIIEKRQRVIVFYAENPELDVLRQLKQDEGLEYAEWNGHKHEPLPTGPKWVYVVQYMAGSEAWNCTETNTMVFYSLTYSYKQWEQAHGRIDRLTTKFRDLHYYSMRSKSSIDMAIWRSLKAKKNFQPSHFDMKNSEFAEISAKS